MGEKKRLKYIDIVKGFSVLLIVLGHILGEYNSTSYFQTWIYSFHVPIFFILTGWLSYEKEYKNSSLKSLIKKDAKSLLYPYFTFSLLFIVWDIFECFILKTSIKTALKDFMLTVSLYGIKTLWFLTCLFIAKVIYYVQQCKLTKKKLYASNIIIIIMVFILTQFIVPIFQGKNGIYLYISRLIQLIGRPLVALLYIYIGAYMHKKLKQKNNIWILIIVLLILNIILGLLNGKVDLYSLKVNNLLLYYLSATFGSLSIILFFKKIKDTKILEFFGKNSLIVMATHQKFPFIGACKKILEKIKLDINVSIVVTFLFLILVEVLLVKIINKHFSFLIKFKEEKKEIEIK